MDDQDRKIYCYVCRKKTRHVKIISDLWYCYECGYVRMLARKEEEKAPGPPKKPGERSV